MTDFYFWQQMALVDAYVDDNGDAWDICDECGLDEEFYKEYAAARWRRKRGDE